jgi:hypothetical protein
MKKVFAVMVVVLAMFFVAGSVFASPQAEKVTYTGYLMDKACWGMGKGMDGSDVKNSPQDHTKMCLVAEPCKESGYGITVKDGSEYMFIKFDDKGDEQAWELIQNSSREMGFSIEVQGELDGDVLVVTDIIET